MLIQLVFFYCKKMYESTWNFTQSPNTLDCVKEGLIKTFQELFIKGPFLTV